jgi:hypothetical protein
MYENRTCDKRRLSVRKGGFTMKAYPDRSRACGARPAILLAALVFVAAAGASGQPFQVDARPLGRSLRIQGLDTRYYYRLTTRFRGGDMCLDVFNGGAMNNMTHLVSCGDYSGQYWRLSGPDAGGWYRLSTSFRGPEMCLDVFNGGQYDNQLHLTGCGDYSGQFWRLSGPDAGDWYRLSTSFRGPETCLDIFNGGQYDNQPHLTGCGDYSGQFWKLTRTDTKVNE